MYYHHKVTSNRLVTSINYMSHGFSSFEEHQFLGWLLVEGHYTWGIDLDGEPHVAVHLFRTPPGFYWGDGERDTLTLADKKPYVLMYYGCDNSSCFRRFTTSEEALAHHHLTNSVNWSDKELIFYNS